MRDTIAHDEKTLAWMRGMDNAIAQYADQPIQTQKQLTTVDALATLQKAVQTSSLADGLTGLKQNNSNSVELHEIKLIKTAQEKKNEVTEDFVSYFLSNYHFVSDKT